MNQNIPDEVMQQMKEERKLFGGIIKLGDPLYKNIIKVILVLLLLPILIVYLVLEFIYNSTDEIKNILWKTLDQAIMMPSYILSLFIYITYGVKKCFQLILRFFIEIYELIERNLYYVKYALNKIYLLLNFIFDHILILFKFIFNIQMKIITLVIKLLGKIYVITKVIAEFAIQKFQTICKYCSKKLLILSEKLFDLFIYLSVGLKIVLKKAYQLITITLEQLVIIVYNFYEAITNIAGIIINFIIKIVKKSYGYFKNYIYKPIKYLFQRLWRVFVQFLVQIKKLAIAIRNLIVTLIVKLSNFLLYIFKQIRMLIKKLKLLMRKLALMIVDAIIYILDKLEKGAFKLYDLFRICIYQPVRRLINYILDILIKTYNNIVYGYNYFKHLIVSSYNFIINQIEKFLKAIKDIIIRLSSSMYKYAAKQKNKIRTFFLNAYNKVSQIIQQKYQTIYSFGLFIFQKIIVIVDKIRLRMQKRQKRFRKLIKLIFQKIGLLIKSVLIQLQNFIADALSLIAKIYRVISSYVIQKLTILFVFIVNKLLSFKVYSQNRFKLVKQLIKRGIFKLISLAVRIMKFAFKYCWLTLFAILLRLLRIYAVFSIILDGVAYGISVVNNKLDQFGSSLALRLVQGLWILIQKLTILLNFILNKLFTFKVYSQNRFKLVKQLIKRGIFKLISLVVGIMKFAFRYCWLTIFAILLRLLRIYAVFSIILDGVAYGISSINNKLDQFGSTLALSLVQGLWICVEYFFKKIKYVGIRLYSYLKALFNITIKVLSFVVIKLKQLTKLIYTIIKKSSKTCYTVFKVYLIKIYKFLYPLIKQLVQTLIKLIKNSIQQAVIALKTVSRKFVQVLQTTKSIVIDLFNKMREILYQIWTPIKQEIVKLFIIMKNSIILAKNILIKQMVQIKSFIKAIFLEVIQILINTQEQIMAFTKKMMMQIKEYVQTQLNSITEALKGYLQEVIKGLIEVKNSIVLQSSIIKEKLIKAKNEFLEVGVSFKNNFIEIKNSMITSIKQLKQSIMQWRN